MIGGLVLFLIFSPQLTKDDELKNKNNNSVEQPKDPETNTPDNGNEENNEDTQEKEETFATKIKLNCDDDILISVGTSVELTSGFITVEPNIYLKDVTTSITVDSGATKGINFSNNIITANDIGRYTIKFSVPKTNNTFINDSLYIRVVSKEEDNKVKLVSNNFTIDTTIPLSEMLEINSIYSNYTLESNEYYTYSNNQITFNKEGNSNILLSINTNFLIYKYCFGFLVKPKVESTIIVEGENNGILQIEKDINEYFEISYFVKYGSGENIRENVSVQLEDDNVIQVIDIVYPIITFKVLEKSSVKLTLTLTKVDIPPKELTIIIK